MKTKSTVYIVQAAVIAALYAALTILQNTLLPGTASMAVQFRVAEVLTILAIFTPAAIPGLTVGCVIANISSLSVLGPYDMIFGMKLEVKKKEKGRAIPLTNTQPFKLQNLLFIFKIRIILLRAVFCQSPAFQSALQAEVRAQTALPARRGLHSLPEKGNRQSENLPQQRKIQSQSLR